MTFSGQRLILGVAVSITIFGCESSSGRREAQWDVDLSSGTYIYAVNGWVWCREASGHSRKLVEGQYPTFAGSNSQIVFSNGHRLWLLNPKSLLVKEIASTGDRNCESAYSTKLGRLFFARYTERGLTRPSGYEIFSCRIDGSDLRQCTSQNYWSLRLSTHPFTGGKMIFAAQSPEKERSFGAPDSKLITLNTSEPFEISTPFQPVQNPWTVTVGCDPNKLIVGTVPLDQTKLYLVDTITKDAKIIFQEPQTISPLPSKNNSEYLFLRDLGQKFSAYSIDRSGKVKELFSF